MGGVYLRFCSLPSRGTYFPPLLPDGFVQARCGRCALLWGVPYCFHSSASKTGCVNFRSLLARESAGGGVHSPQGSCAPAGHGKCSSASHGEGSADGLAKGYWARSHMQAGSSQPFPLTLRAGQLWGCSPRPFWEVGTQGRAVALPFRKGSKWL